MRAVFPFILILVVLLGGSVASAQSSIFQTVGDPVPPEVERMYQKGLHWLMTAQNKQGTWSGGYGSEPAVVGLALLAILAHGDDPNWGTYRETVKKCLEHILKNQNKDSGYIGSSMYNHGFATLALAEAYGAVADERLGPALEKAVALILSSQKNNPMGAWRYSPGSNDADTTVSGACFVALVAAQNAGVAVPQKAIDRALKFYQNCACPGGGFGYTSASGPNFPRSAIGLLVFSLARDYESREARDALRFLRSSTNNSGGYYHYYLYYAAQAFFQSDFDYWREWNSKHVKRSLKTQEKDGSWKNQQGKCFSTVTTLLSLALNYRFLPIYER